MKTAVLALAAIAVVALFPAAGQAESGFYLAAKVGATSVDADLDDSFSQILDGDDEGFGLGLGLKLGDYLAFELAYHDFGEVGGTSAACADVGDPCIALVVPIEGDTTALSLSFLPHLPLSDNFFVYGKLGLTSWETSLTGALPALEARLEEYSDEDLLYGLGVRFLLPGPVGVFAEVERVGDGFETVLLGATLGF